MSNIVIVLKQETVEASVLMDLHKLLGRSLSEIKNDIANGMPIFEREIFDHQQFETAELLGRLIDLIRRRELDVRVFELVYGEVYATSDYLPQSLITLDILENILNAADDELEHP